LSGIVFGVLVGILFVVSEQMVPVFLDQKELEEVLNNLNKP